MIAHITRSIDQKEGGPAISVTGLYKEMVLDNRYVTKLGCMHSPNPVISEGAGPISDNLKFSKKGLLGFSVQLKRWLIDNPFDLFHGHGIWHPSVHQMAVVANYRSKPYIISPRGMLEPWSLRQKHLKKQVALLLYQHKDLAGAACLHATAPMEAANLRALGLHNPIAVIPNGIPLEEFPLKDSRAPVGKRQLLFLSRLHPKKGLELLLQAWAGLPQNMAKAWELRIAGNGEETYVKQLQRVAAALGCGETVTFMGPLYGEAKVNAYQEASLFVLPTYSENFGIVVAEALACGTPVITTRGAPWEDLEKHHCGWWIPTGLPALQACLQAAMALPEPVLRDMGHKGRQLVEHNYSMASVARQMQQVYDWLLGQGPQPAFVLNGATP